MRYEVLVTRMQFAYVTVEADDELEAQRRFEDRLSDDYHMEKVLMDSLDCGDGCMEWDVIGEANDSCTYTLDL